MVRVDEGLSQLLTCPKLSKQTNHYLLYLIPTTARSPACKQYEQLPALFPVLSYLRGQVCDPGLEQESQFLRLSAFRVLVRSP